MCPTGKHGRREKRKERVGSKSRRGVSASHVSLISTNLVALEQPPSGVLDVGNRQAHALNQVK